MNWSQVEGRWRELAGQLKSQWAKLTDEDLEEVAGRREQLLRKLQGHYDVLEQDAETQLDKWLAKMNPGHGEESP